MAKKALGTTISKGGTVIGYLKSISPVEKSADELDITTLDAIDGYKKFMQGAKDGGEVVLGGHYESADAGQAALDAAFDSGAEDTYIITYPATIGATYTFIGIVTGVSAPGEANIDDPLEFEVTIKITGKPVLATTASAGVSAATFVQTDGSTALTLAASTPVFAIGTYFYTFTFTTQSSFKPKITAASHTIKLYVDGVYTEDLTSGNAGTAIAIGAAATKKLDVVVYEAGKSPKTYTFMVSRLS